MRTLYSLVYFLLVITVPFAARAQQAGDSLLTVERIYSSREFAASRGETGKWEPDGSGYYAEAAAADSAGGQNIIRINTRTGDTTIVVPASELIPPGSKKPLDFDEFEFSASRNLMLFYTNSQRVWRQNTRGDYWILNRTTRKMHKVYPDADPSSLMFAKLSPDEKTVAFVYRHDLYTEDLATGTVTRRTHDGSTTIINGTFDWVYEEEFDLRDGFRWSPDGKSIAFWQLDASGIGVYDMLNTTDSLYPRVIPVQYPKAGTKNSACRLGVLSLSSGKTVWLKSPGDPRNTYIARMQWTPDSREVMFQHLNRAQNIMEVMLGNPVNGDVRTIVAEKDSAWIDVVDNVEWFNNGRDFLWTSERSGWRHPYLISRDGAQVRELIREPMDMISVVRIDTKNGVLYFNASPDNAAQQYLYRVPITRQGKPERLTPASEPGWHTYDMNDSCTFAFHTYSTISRPPVTDIVTLPDHAVLRRLSDNAALVEKLGKLRRGPAGFMKVDAAGVQLDAWYMQPPGFDPAKKYPVIFYVYTEPASQTVLDRWSSRNYLWHLMMTQKGYIIMSVDNRGTPAPRGAEFRKCIYKKLGVVNSLDQANAVQSLLASCPYLDPARVGIWGWSGGGSATLNAMFRYPQLYKTGVAVAALSNEHYYDTIYEERYMGLLPENEAFYDESSAVRYAKNLAGNLLVVHGTGDDNVHYQNCEALINELVKNNRQFTMMAYPNRTHGIFEGPGTTLHLWTTITNYFLDHLK